MHTKTDETVKSVHEPPYCYFLASTMTCGYVTAELKGTQELSVLLLQLLVSQTISKYKVIIKGGWLNMVSTSNGFL